MNFGDPICRRRCYTRWRDFADVLTISAMHEMSASELAVALRTVADYGRVPLRPLLPALGAMAASAQATWASWYPRQAHTITEPSEATLGRTRTG